MKRMLIHLLLITGVLAATGPASAFACSSPCRMTQEQMLRCAQICSEGAGSRASVGREACVKFQVKDAAQFTGLGQAPELVPVHAGMVVVCAAVRPLQTVAGLESLRGPPLGLRSYLQCGIPTNNAPPVLI